MIWSSMEGKMKIDNQKVEQAANRQAMFLARVRLAKSGAAGAHGGGKRAQTKKRRQEARREAKGF